MLSSQAANETRHDLAPRVESHYGLEARVLDIGCVQPQFIGLQFVSSKVKSAARLHWRQSRFGVSLCVGWRSVKVIVDERSRFSRCIAVNLDLFPVRTIDEMIRPQWNQC